jgi:hypothetical protein
MLPGELRTLQADIENKKARLDKIKSDIKSANFDERLTEKSQKAKTLDDKRDQLTAEFRALSMQSDTRIRLGVKTTELKAKISDVNNMYASGILDLTRLHSVFSIDTNKARFRKLVGVDPHADTMEHELDRALQYVTSDSCSPASHRYVFLPEKRIDKLLRWRPMQTQPIKLSNKQKQPFLTRRLRHETSRKNLKVSHDPKRSCDSAQNYIRP